MTTAAGLPRRPRLLLDCDPGHDDALAIIVAARHAEILGITTVAGNVGLESTTRNALVVSELCGLDVPVVSGADRPLVAPPVHATAIHGAGGLDGPVVRAPTRSVAGHDAAGFIAATVDAHPPGSVWLVATGPLTNVAVALGRHPPLAGRLAGLSFMGGAARGGNVTPVAEFNVWADPEAAAAVLDAAVTPTVMSGLDVTLLLDLDDDVVERLRRRPDHPASVFCADLVATYLDRQEAATGHRHGPAHDVCAVLAVTHPHLLSTRPRAVEVELGGTRTRGMTVVDERRTDRGRSPNVQVGVDLDAPAAVAVIVDAIASL